MKRQLVPDKTYGADIIVKEAIELRTLLKTGDHIFAMGNQRRSTLGGKIIKLNPKKLVYESTFMNGDTYQASHHYWEFIESECFVTRNENIVHEVMYADKR